MLWRIKLFFHLKKIVDLAIYHVDEDEGHYVLEENTHYRVAAHEDNINI